MHRHGDIAQLADQPRDRRRLAELTANMRAARAAFAFTRMSRTSSPSSSGAPRRIPADTDSL